MSVGTLFVLGTPLGNLGDLSARAAETLLKVPVVAAEDTRRTRRLLDSIGAHPDRVISYHSHSDVSRLSAILKILSSGEDVVLATDAGTPGISDPGGGLVAAAHSEGISVVPLPGPSAVAVALSASGLPADSYLFLGFLPRKGQSRKERLKEIADSRITVVVFEAANRLVNLLEELITVAGGNRQAVVARELTKLHEEIRPGPLQTLFEHYDEVVPRGEVTLVISGGTGPVVAPVDPVEVSESARGWLESGESPKAVVRRVSSEFGISRNEAYRLVMDLDR